MFTSSPQIAQYIYLLAKRKGLFFVSAFVIMSLGTLFTYLVPNKYEASCTVFIEKNVISQLVQGIALTPSMDDSIRVLTSAMNSRANILKVLGDVDFDLKGRNEAEVEKLITELQRNTEIKVANRDLFRVKFKYTNAVIARDYVNSLVRHYIEENTSSKRSESTEATNFLTDQIAIYNNKMAQLESEVNQYKNEKGSIVNLDPGQLFREINGAQQKLFDLEFRRKQLEEEKNYVKEASDPSRQKLVVLLKKLDELRSQYTETYPEILSIKSQIEALQEELKVQKTPNGMLSEPRDIWKLDAELKALRANEISLQRNIAENKSLLASIPSSKTTLEKLEAARNSQKSMHDLLAMRNNQAEMSKQMGLQDKGTNFRVVDPAVTPVLPASPNRIKLLLMSIIAGFAGGMAIIMLLERLDGTVKLVDTLRPLGFPILAVIPLIKSKEEILIEKRQAFNIYVASGVSFSIFITIFLLELLKITVIQDLFIKLHLPQLVAILFKN